MGSLKWSHLFLLPPLIPLLFLQLFTAVAGDCAYGKHSSVAAISCREILDIQVECYGKSGHYWLNTGGTEYETYCDMEHQGGGWTRILEHLPDSSTNCPTGWKNAWLSSGSTLYCQRGPESEGYVAYQRWNEDGAVRFSEVRGYLILRVQEGSTPDGFSDNLAATLDSEYMDGIAIELLVSSTLPPRNIFSYVIGRTDPWYKCPKPGVSYVSQHPQALPSYNEYSYACDELVASGDVDGDGYYSEELFEPEIYCKMCPLRMPWFQVAFGEAVNKTLQVRFVDGRGNDYGISVKRMEIYVR